MAESAGAVKTEDTGCEGGRKMGNEPMRIGSERWRRLVKDGARSFGVTLDESQLDCMALHAEELLRWNRRINLTAITEPAEVAVKHFLDSLAAVPLVAAGASVLDMGSGGGFPGLPLAAALPQSRVTLVDSVRKKVSFLKHVIRRSGLQGATALQARIEELSGHADHRGRYEAVLARALAPLEELARLAAPLLAPQGAVIALKAERVAEEMRLLEENPRRNTSGLRVRVAEVREVKLPVLNLRRWIVVMKTVHGG